MISCLSCKQIICRKRMRIFYQSNQATLNDKEQTGLDGDGREQVANVCKYLQVKHLPPNGSWVRFKGAFKDLKQHKITSHSQHVSVSGLSFHSEHNAIQKLSDQDMNNESSVVPSVFLVRIWLQGQRLLALPSHYFCRPTKIHPPPTLLHLYEIATVFLCYLSLRLLVISWYQQPTQSSYTHRPQHDDASRFPSIFIISHHQQQQQTTRRTSERWDDLYPQFQFIALLNHHPNHAKAQKAHRRRRHRRSFLFLICRVLNGRPHLFDNPFSRTTIC